MKGRLIFFVLANYTDKLAHNQVFVLLWLIFGSDKHACCVCFSLNQLFCAYLSSLILHTLFFPQQWTGLGWFSFDQTNTVILWIPCDKLMYKLLQCYTISLTAAECVAFSPSRPHTRQSPFNSLTSFQITIVDFSYLQSLFPADFCRRHSRKNKAFFPSKRSTPCHFLMFIHSAESKSWMEEQWNMTQHSENIQLFHFTLECRSWPWVTLCNILQ